MNPRIDAPTPLVRTPCIALLGLLLTLGCSSTESTAPEPDPTPANTPPTAAAGDDQSVSLSLPVQLDGSTSSDADGDPITWAWSIVSAPSGSTAALDDATSATPSFTPDVAGAFTVSLTVSDGTEDSAADQVTITAEDNTASASIDDTGGSIASLDGTVALEFPAGALAAAETITMTPVGRSQRPTELGGMDEDGIVYELGPDGLTFAQPVTVRLDAVGDFAPTLDGDSYRIPVLSLASVSGGTVELPGAQTVVADLDAMTSEMTATISHFSSLAFDWTEWGTSKVVVTVKHPESAEVGVPFDVELRADARDLSVETLVIMDDSRFPLQLAAPIDQEAAQQQYECAGPGTGLLWVEFTMTGTELHGVGEPHTLDDPVVLRAIGSINCYEPIRDFQDFSVPAPEGLSSVETYGPEEALGPPATPGAMVVAHQGGARLTDDAGATLADFSALELSGADIFEAAGNRDDGVVLATSQGLFAYPGSLPTDAASPASLPLTPIPSPLNGPDLTGRATDVFSFGVAGSQGLVAVLFQEQDLALFTSGWEDANDPGYDFRDDLANAFRPGGTSIFGSHLPVSAAVQPEGFTEQHEMLVVTVAPDASEETKLWRVTLSGAVAAATEVTTVFPSPGGRRLRCKGSVCGLTSYGTAVGMGGMTRFIWDGNGGVSPIAGFGGGRSIGTDVRILDPTRALIARTAFLTGSITVTEVTTSGEFLNSVSIDVPATCEGPGHVLFRQDDELIVTCNTSGDVISIPFQLPPQ